MGEWDTEAGNGPRRLRWLASAGELVLWSLGLGLVAGLAALWHGRTFWPSFLGFAGAQFAALAAVGRASDLLAQRAALRRRRGPQ